MKRTVANQSAVGFKTSSEVPVIPSSKSITAPLEYNGSNLSLASSNDQTASLRGSSISSLSESSSGLLQEISPSTAINPLVPLSTREELPVSGCNTLPCSLYEFEELDSSCALASQCSTYNWEELECNVTLISRGYCNALQFEEINCTHTTVACSTYVWEELGFFVCNSTLPCQCSLYEFEETVCANAN